MPSATGGRIPVVVSVAALLLSPAIGHRAYADGGVRSPEAVPVHRAAEEIILVDNPDPTITAIIQLRSVGPSQRFAWVVPVPGKPAVGVSSNAVFQRLDAATAPEYWVEVTVEGMCMHRDDADAALDGSGPGLGSLESQVAADTVSANVPDPNANIGHPVAVSSGANGTPSAHHAMAPVVVIDHGSVGPYDYVNVQVDPTWIDPTKVATDWLTMHGYDLTSLDPQVLRRSLKDGLHLLAFKLTHDTDVGAIRPVVLTYESKLPVIPMAPTAAGARGIQAWVIGPSQAVPDEPQVTRHQRRDVRLADRPEVRRWHVAVGGGWPFRSQQRHQAEQLRRGRERGRPRGRRPGLRHRAWRAGHPVQGQGLVVDGRPAASRRSRASATRTESTPS